jgi:hypothetical protein
VPSFGGRHRGVEAIDRQFTGNPRQAGFAFITEEVRLAGFEPTTFCSGGRRSIR